MRTYKTFGEQQSEILVRVCRALYSTRYPDILALSKAWNDMAMLMERHEELQFAAMADSIADGYIARAKVLQGWNGKKL